jgi:hypothetical protein
MVNLVVGQLRKYKMIQNHEHLLVGYCPKCGTPIYSNDFKRFESIFSDERTKENVGIYKCLRCTLEYKTDDLIPF